VRQQAEVLEHHAHLVAANVDQLIFRGFQQVAAVQQNLPGRRLHQARQAAHHGGLTGARKPHDDENFAGLHIEGDVAGRDHVGILAHPVA
jgi:hypothetical protein